MKKKKIRITIAIAVAILLIAAIAVIFGEIALKTGIEKAASKALGVEVSISDLDVSIFSGTASITGVKVKNPQGYNIENLLELDRVDIKANLSSMLSQTVIVQSVHLDGMNVSLEQKGLSNNLKDVMDFISSRKKDKSKELTSSKQLQIDELKITGITVKAKFLPIPGQSDVITLNIKPIIMKDLGKDKKLHLAVLSGKIITAVIDSIVEQGIGTFPDDVIGTMESALKGTLSLGEKVAEETLEKGREVIDAGKDIIEGFKGLLDKDKK